MNKFFFVHLQKTGGISLLWRLRRVFPDPSTYPNQSDGDTWADGPQMSTDLLMQRWANPERRNEIQLIAGHFPLCSMQLLRQEFISFTVLREPVERTLSFLRHYRINHPAAGERSLEEIYEDPFIARNILRNHMTKMLSLTTKEMTDGVLTDIEMTSDHLQRATENLAAMKLVGVTERLEDFAQLLAQEFTWDLGSPIYSNDTPPARVSQAFRKRIARDSSVDVELYRYADELNRAVTADRPRR